MSSSSDFRSRMKALETLTIDNRDRIGRRTDVPFIVFTYDPDDELSMENTIDGYVEKLKARGQTVALIDVRDMVFGILQDQGILEDVIEKEKTTPEELGEGLSTALLGGRTDKRGKLTSAIIDRIDGADTAVMYRTGILYPFAGVSSILIQLENVVETPLVVFYPAVRDGKSLRFLDKTEGTYYRARVI